MRPIVVVHAEARRELIEARAYYDERREGFGPLFVDAVEREFQLLAEFPRIGKPLVLGAQRWSLRHRQSSEERLSAATRR